MPDQPHNWLQVAALGLVAMVAGGLDYLHRLLNNKQAWGWLSLAMHLVLSLFSGLIAVTMVTEMGYSLSFAGAAAGAAGWMNVRVFELIEIKYKGKG